MPTNQFYYLLQSNSENIFSGGVVVIPDRSSLKFGNFVVIELPPRGVPYSYKIANARYGLRENHISIYENVRKEKKDCVYHGTFVLIDEVTNDRCKLHAYFNDEDQCVQIQFRKDMPDIKDSIPLNEVEKTWLAELVRQRCSSYMIHLRAVRNERIQTMEAELAHTTQMIAEYLRNPIEDALRECLNDMIAPALEKAKALASYSGDDTATRVLLSYQRAIEWKIGELQHLADAQEEVAASPIEEALESPLTPAASSSQAPAPSAQAVVAEQLKAFQKQLTDSVEELKKIQAENPIASDQILEYHQKASDALILLLSCPAEFKSDSKQIAVIDKALRESRDKGRSLLTEKIILGQWADVKKLLNYFGKDLPDRVIASIIVQDKDEILDQLIRQDSSLVFRCRPKRNEKRYSLLEFAFVKERKKCFKKLLERGASSLEPVQDDALRKEYAIGPIQDLPLAHIIFQQSIQNPFRVGLNLHYINSQFVELRALKLTLQAHLEQLDESISLEVKTKLEGFVDAYTSAITTHERSCSSSTRGITAQRQRQQTLWAASVFENVNVDVATVQHPEIQRKQAEIQRKQAEINALFDGLLKKLDSHERQQVLRASDEHQELMKKYLEAGGPMETRLEKIIGSLDQKLEELKLSNQLCDIRANVKQLMNGNTSNKKKRKSLNASIIKEKEVKEKLREYVTNHKAVMQEMRAYIEVSEESEARIQEMLRYIEASKLPLDRKDRIREKIHYIEASELSFEAKIFLEGSLLYREIGKPASQGDQASSSGTAQVPEDKEDKDDETEKSVHYSDSYHP